MRLSRKAKENMLMYQGLPKPPQSADGKKRADDTARRARTKRKAVSKIQFIIIPLPGRAGNPKKNPKLRRARGKLATYVPFVLLNISEFRTKHYPKRKKQNPQMDINTRLIIRAHQAQQAGGYFHINPEANHGKAER